MNPSGLTITTRPAGPASMIADMRGDITAQAEAALAEAYAAANEAGATSLILNFTAVDYMNSSGIGMLVTLLIRMRRQGQRMLAFGLSEHYRHILQLTRLDEAINICATEADAVESASQPAPPAV